MIFARIEPFCLFLLIVAPQIGWLEILPTLPSGVACFLAANIHHNNSVCCIYYLKKKRKEEEWKKKGLHPTEIPQQQQQKVKK